MLDRGSFSVNPNRFLLRHNFKMNNYQEKITLLTFSVPSLEPKMSGSVKFDKVLSISSDLRSPLVVFIAESCYPSYLTDFWSRPNSHIVPNLSWLWRYKLLGSNSGVWSLPSTSTFVARGDPLPSEESKRHSSYSILEYSYLKDLSCWAA